MRTHAARAGVLAGTLMLGAAVGGAEARHWQFAIEDQGHVTPIEGFYSSCPECEALLGDPAALRECTARLRCQPLIGLPPDPDPRSGACLPEDAIASDGEHAGECGDFESLASHSKRSCCLQYEIARKGIRGYQLAFGPYDMTETVDGRRLNDEFTIGYAKLPNAAVLDAEASPYEYMVGFEFWQYAGSHHFIMDDLLGPFNDPARPRGRCSGGACEECTAGLVCDEDDDATTCAGKQERCRKFAALPETCPASGDGVDPRNNGGTACDSGNDMRGFPLAGSPGPSYFPVPYPDGVGIRISREHVFRMTHHLQDWFDPQRARVWINVYTRPAKDAGGNETIAKEAHVFFDGSGSVFLIPPHSIGRTQGLWVAPRNIELYGLTGHSHKRNVLFTADLIGVDGEVRSLPARSYQYSHPVCGGFRRVASGPDGRPMPDDPVDTANPPRHLFESIDWADHEQCPFWREDGDNNDTNGAILVRQGEGIRYECVVNNGVLPAQAMAGSGLPPATGDPSIDATLRGVFAGVRNSASSYPAGTLAFQEVPLEPRDAFGRVVRGKFSCEEIGPKTACEMAGGGEACAGVPDAVPGVIPGFPGAGALGYYGNRPCLPDALKGLEPHEDFATEETARAVLHGGPATECRPEDGWTQFRQQGRGFPFEGRYTGRCVPASIGFAETEDDEMCILLGLYAFADGDDDPVPNDASDDVVPIGTNGPLGENGIDRLPTDVGR